MLIVQLEGARRKSMTGYHPRVHVNDLLNRAAERASTGNGAITPGSGQGRRLTFVNFLGGVELVGGHEKAPFVSQPGTSQGGLVSADSARVVDEADDSQGGSRDANRVRDCPSDRSRTAGGLPGCGVQNGVQDRFYRGKASTAIGRIDRQTRVSVTLFSEKPSLCFTG